MQSVDFHTPISTQLGPKTANKQCLTKFARRWDGRIRRELGRFAQYIWPDARLLGLIPINSYRKRKHLESGKFVWWVERDIPPFDRSRCEAYRVELSLDGSDQPQMAVRSGISIYPVIPMSVEGLKIALVRAGVDKPLIIWRQFGPALDP